MVGLSRLMGLLSTNGALSAKTDARTVTRNKNLPSKPLFLVVWLIGNPKKTPNKGAFRTRKGFG